MTRSYYVYVLRDPLNSDVPFYVGKGQGRRATLHYTSKTTRGYNPRKDAVIDAIAKAGMIPLIETCWTGTDEDIAYLIERDIIGQYGRRGIDKGGILTNLSEGGDGCRRPKGAYAGEKNPFFGKTHSDQTKRLISENNARIGGFRNRQHTKETKKKISLAKHGQIPWIAGRKHTEAARQKMRNAYRPNSYWKGKHHSIETRNKIAATLTGRTQPDDAKEKNRQAQLLRYSGPEGELRRLETSVRMTQYWAERRK